MAVAPPAEPLRPAASQAGAAAAGFVSGEEAAGSPPRRMSRFDRPLFIVWTPRSGSTLLFETLGQAPGLYLARAARATG